MSTTPETDDPRPLQEYPKRGDYWQRDGQTWRVESVQTTDHGRTVRVNLSKTFTYPPRE